MARKKPEVTTRRYPSGKRAGRILAWVEEDGGFVLPCGCFVGASAKELRILVGQTGPDVMVEVVRSLEEEHAGCK